MTASTPPSIPPLSEDGGHAVARWSWQGGENMERVAVDLLLVIAAWGAAALEGSNPDRTREAQGWRSTAAEGPRATEKRRAGAGGGAQIGRSVEDQGGGGQASRQPEQGSG